MGLFSTFIEINEETHSARLLSQAQWMVTKTGELDGRLQYAIMMGYLQIRGKLKQEMLNWSREGRIKIGREMQSQAEKKFDFDIAGSYPKYLAGIWIESHERNTLKAQQAFEMLESFADYIERQFQQRATAALADIPVSKPNLRGVEAEVDPIHADRPPMVTCAKCGASYVVAVYCHKCHIKLEW